MSVPKYNNDPTPNFRRSLDNEFTCSYDHAVLIPIEQIKANPYAHSQTVNQNSTSSASSTYFKKQPITYQLVYVSKDSYATVFRGYTRIQYLGPVSSVEWQIKIQSARSDNELLSLSLCLNKEIDLIRTMLQYIRENESVNPAQIEWLETHTIKNLTELNLCFLHKKFVTQKAPKNPKPPSSNPIQGKPFTMLAQSAMQPALPSSTTRLIFSSITNSGSAQSMPLSSSATKKPNRHNAAFS